MQNKDIFGKIILIPTLLIHSKLLPLMRWPLRSKLPGDLDICKGELCQAVFKVRQELTQPTEPRIKVGHDE